MGLTVDDISITVQPPLIILVLFRIRILLPKFGIIFNTTLDTTISTSVDNHRLFKSERNCQSKRNKKKRKVERGKKGKAQRLEWFPFTGTPKLIRVLKERTRRLKTSFADYIFSSKKNQFSTPPKQKNCQVTTNACDLPIVTAKQKLIIIN